MFNISGSTDDFLKGSPKISHLLHVSFEKIQTWMHLITIFNKINEIINNYDTYIIYLIKVVCHYLSSRSILFYHSTFVLLSIIEQELLPTV